MKKQLLNISNLLLFILPFAFSNSVSAQVVNTQSFDGVTFPPTGWSYVGTSIYWSRVVGGNNPAASPHSGTGMGRYNSFTSPLGTRQTMSTPKVDLSGIGTDTAYFSFWIYRNSNVSTAHDSMLISINTTQSTIGATTLGIVARLRTDMLPDTQATNGWYQYSFDVPASFNTATNYIMLTGISQVGNNMFIDDIVWTSYPTLCSGTPTPGTITSVDTVLCGGTGSTTLSLNGNTTGTGITYQWKSGPSPTGPWTNFGTSVTSISTGTITSTTYYYNVVTCSNSSMSDSTAVKRVTVSATPYPAVNITSSNNGNYCAGIQVRLVATGGSTYTWSPATNLNVTNNDTVLSSPAGSAGTLIVYTSTGINAAGCIGTDTIHVTVRATTTIEVQAIPNDTICIGELLVLNGASGGGAALSQFSWSPGGATSQSITIAPSVSAPYSIQAVNAYGCPTADTLPIEVISAVLPVINSLTASNNASYCNGLTPVTLTVAGTGAVSTTWTPSTGLNMTSGNTVLASPTGVGSSILYGVTLTNSGGCSTSDTIRVYSHALPTVSVQATPNDTICIGESVTLMAQGTSLADTFHWVPTNDMTQSITVSPASHTMYVVHVISGVSGCPNSDTLHVEALAVPVASYTFTPPVDSIVTFTNTSTNGTSYLWDFDDASGSTLQNPPPHTYSVNGTYSVKLVVTNGYCTDSVTHLVDITVAVNELNAGNGLSVFLNQSTDMAYVRFNSTQSKAVLQIINSLGQIVSERVVTSTGNNAYKEEVDMSYLPAGVYSIHISTSSANFSKKLIKM